MKISHPDYVVVHPSLSQALWVWVVHATRYRDTERNVAQNLFPVLWNPPPLEHMNATTAPQIKKIIPQKDYYASNLSSPPCPINFFIQGEMMNTFASSLRERKLRLCHHFNVTVFLLKRASCKRQNIKQQRIIPTVMHNDSPVNS